MSIQAGSNFMSMPFILKKRREVTMSKQEKQHVPNELKGTHARRMAKAGEGLACKLSMINA